MKAEPKAGTKESEMATNASASAIPPTKSTVSLPVTSSEPAAKQSAAPQPSQAPAKPAVTITDLLERFVNVKTITDLSSHFKFEGICTKCGWHTMQLSRSDTYTLVRQHVLQHWRDVSHLL